MNPTAIETMAVARLRPSAGNARTHSKKQIRQIAGSIARFGFANPILIDGENNVAGHGRLEAAKLLGLLPVAVRQTFERQGNLKFANKLYLLQQTAFPGGKPRNDYEDLVPFLPWLLPAGLAASIILLLAGIGGLLWRRQSLAQTGHAR